MRYEKPDMEIITFGANVDTIGLSVGTGSGSETPNPFSVDSNDVAW